MNSRELLSLLEIPSISDSVTIDGRTNEKFWESAISLRFENKENSYYDQGGETQIAVRDGFLFLSAHAPDSGRLVARSAGVNPAWWREDMIRWMFRFRSPVTGSNNVIVLSVNPFGAASLGSVRDIYNINRNDFLSLAPVSWSDKLIVQSRIEKEEWTVEAALPLEYFDSIGFLSVERVRVPRVNTPEMSWAWPAVNEQVNYKLEKDPKVTLPLVKRAGIPHNDLIGQPEKPLTGLAAEIASLPKKAWINDDVTKMLENSIRNRVDSFALEERNAWEQVKTLEGWDQFRNKRLNALLDWIGPLPVRTPLNAVITGEINNGNGFIIENLVFESRPGMMVTCNLYLPDKIPGKIPAIVVVHSHHAPKTQSELQDMGMTWARTGTAVLVMDQLCAGERIQSQPWSREGYYGRYALGNQLYLAGESLIKWMAWDIIRGIDLLTDRKYIDVQRIVLMGAVAGGGDPAALAANLDPRIAAVIPFNFGEAGPEEHYTEGPRRYDFETADPGWAFWETTRNMPKSISGQFFPWFVCAAGAPRNFIYAFEIGWPETLEDEPAWSRFSKVYGLYGAKDHLASVSGFGPFPGPGECTNVGTFLRKRIYPVLNQWLEIPVPEREYHSVLPESALMCLTHSVAAERKLKTASEVCLELAVKRLNESRSKRFELPVNERAASLRDVLKQKLGDIDPEASGQGKELWKRQFSDFAVNAFSIETDDDISVPVFLITPKNASPNRPVVIALAEGGKEGFLLNRPNEIATLLAEGISVCLPDVRGCGELAATRSRGPGAMSLAATELMLGGTLTGSRLKDVRTILLWLAGIPGIDPEHIALWGDSFSEPNKVNFQFYQSPGQQTGPVRQRQAEPLGPFLAVLTALYEEKIAAVACDGGIISFSSALEDNFCQVPQDVIVPGLLEVADNKDIVRAILPRPVMLTGTVNGLNMNVSIEMMNHEYGNDLHNLFMDEKSGRQSLVHWLIQQSKDK